MSVDSCTISLFGSCQSLYQRIYLLLAHAVREQIISKRLSVVNIGQLRFVINA